MERILLVLFALLILPNLSHADPAPDKFGTELKALQSYVKHNNVGEVQDVWLTTRTTPGTDEPVALIFGYADDKSACEAFAKALNQKWSKAHFRCRF